MSEELESFVSQQLPHQEDRDLLKLLLETFKKEGAEAVKEKIATLIDELRGV